MGFRVRVAGGSEGADTSRVLGAHERLYGILPLMNFRVCRGPPAGGTLGRCMGQTRIVRTVCPFLAPWCRRLYRNARERKAKLGFVNFWRLSCLEMV